MKINLYVLITFISILANSTPNWQRLKTHGGKCGASYFYNMRETERTDPNHVSVNQKSLGFAAKGIIELTTSASKEKLPIFGEFLDIFIEKIETKDGYDYWKECVPKGLKK